MTEASIIVGVVLVVLGCIAFIYGSILCWTTKGEFFQEEEVRAMMAHEAVEEKARREEEDKRMEEEQDQADREEGKMKKRGIIIAS